MKSDLYLGCDVSSYGLADLIESIGEPGFETRLSGLVETTCGADYMYLFHVSGQEPRVRTALSADGGGMAAHVADAYASGQWWRFDPTMRKACTETPKAPQIYMTDIMRTSSSHLRSALYGRMHLRDRVMICGRAADDVIGMSMLRSTGRGPFESDQRAQVEGFARFVFPLVAKHLVTVERDQRLSRALTDLGLIESCVALADEALTPREASVCSRYLYGQSTDGIAVELNIGRETVITYRKRLYDRLGIASHRELLLWYLDLYGSMRGRISR